MRVLPGIQEETPNVVEVFGGNGAVADTFTAIWRTPNDDESLEIKAGYFGLASKMNSVRDADMRDDPEQQWKILREGNEFPKIMIRNHLIRVDDPSYEEGDLERMLPHANYKAALIKSLMGVVNGEASLGNSKTPEPFGKPANSPAARKPDSTESRKKKPTSSPVS